MKSHVAVIVLVALLAATAVAAPPVNGGFGCFGPTVGLVDFSGLDDAFSTTGITQKLASLQWGFGGAGYALINRVVIGGSGWGSSQTVGSHDLRATVEIAGGEFDLGYQVFSLKHLLIAPVLGIGGGGYTVELQKLSGAPFTFDSLLKNPGYTSKVSFSGLTLSPQLMVTIPISFVGLQLKGGYCYTPTNPEWGLEGGSKLSSGPAISQGMPFATLNVVFGGFEGGTRRHRGRK
jgi:opacity protein-like surface antigen